MLRTQQSMGSDAESIRLAMRKKLRLRTLLRQSVARRLQRKIATHIYRPQGPMFRNLQASFVATVYRNA